MFLMMVIWNNWNSFNIGSHVVIFEFNYFHIYAFWGLIYSMSSKTIMYSFWFKFRGLISTYDWSIVYSHLVLCRAPQYFAVIKMWFPMSNLTSFQHKAWFSDQQCCVCYFGFGIVFQPFPRFYFSLFYSGI